MTTAPFSAPEHREMPSPDARRAYPAEYERDGRGDLSHDPRCKRPSEFVAPRFAHLHRCNQPLVNHRCSMHGHQGESK